MLCQKMLKNWDTWGFTASGLTLPPACLIQRGGAQGIQTPMKNHKNIGFLSNTGLDSRKWQSYQASIQCWVIIGTPVKHHLNGVSLSGQWWPAYSVTWILSSKKKKKKNAKSDPLWQNFLDSRMPGQVRLKTVMTKIKCRIMQHFIRIYIASKGKKDLQTKEYNIFGKI